MATETVLSDGNLPAEPNSFIGRERDLAELARLLSDVRVLTLCGPGGIGKTRLALRLAVEIVTGFPDGAWLVELADTEDPALVTRKVASALGIREEPDRPLTETVTEALRPRRMLLILDTCEHVVDASAALVQQLLGGCPELRVVTTSREPLRVRGETVWRVPPLALPPAADELDAGDLAQHEAIRLFAARAAAVRPGFTLGAGNTGAVARLCRTLDGMPLAIELAAARVGALSVEQIAARLGDRFQLLASGDRTAPARQQTLRAAVDWSYELLIEPEQALLRRLAVFSGWNLDMAEQVCADEAIPARQVLDLLAALIDKSLVTLDTEVDGFARYRLLDTIKEYASDRLHASGEGPAMRLRHRDYMLRLAEGIVAQAFVRGDPPWPVRVALYQRVGVERTNCRTALTACLEFGEPDEGLRLSSALRSPWVTHGDVTEGLVWFDRFLGLPGEVAPQVRAQALIHRAELAFEQQDYAVAAQSAQAGLDLCRSSGSAGGAGALRVLAVVSLRAGKLDEAMGSIGSAIETARADRDDWEEGLALAVKATMIARQGKLQEAQRAFQESLDVLQDNNGWGVAHTLYGFGNLARARRDHEAAIGHFRSALVLYREIDARPEIARCLAGIGWVALSRGDLELASASLTESLELSQATGQRLAVARGLEAFAMLAVASGDPARAMKLEGAALALREAVGHVPSSLARSRLDDLLDSARRQMGPAVADGLLADGAAMSAHDAVRFATGSDGGALPGDAVRPAIPPQLPATLSSGAASTLTAREREIAALIARGLSNRGIADELVISPATAARHVANIFTKLGFSSRAQVAAWAAQRESDSQDRQN
ncbi:MAG TPA: tetratricopeptide repeat protein [Streptosporangiaceae bacterium]|jgi:predicted ATPase/DNA-binding CsgD family transcriptional regulator